VADIDKERVTRRLLALHEALRDLERPEAADASRLVAHDLGDLRTFARIAAEWLPAR